ncbi:MAG: hypothetical protein QF578_21305 [Alphaproteobacteria bacterium]|jgi:hypothetical protein|nr:hypothetical protein [Alphaproteobacteria bacterium]MDP6816297.1 hypothetical protein [Alphaproteobacteria bacterium]
MSLVHSLMPWLNRHPYRKHIIAFLLLAGLTAGGLPTSPALAGPLPDLGAGSWTGIGYGTADTGAGPADEMLGGFLYVKWNPLQKGIARAEWAEVGAGPGGGGPGVKVVKKFRVQNVSTTVSDFFTLNYLLRFTGSLFSPACVPPSCHDVVQVGGSMIFETTTTLVTTIVTPIENEAEVKVKGMANGDVDVDQAADGPQVAPAAADATAEKSNEGEEVDVVIDLGTEWGVFSSHTMSIDGGPAEEIGTSSFEKDADNNYTVAGANATSNVPANGTPPPPDLQMDSFFDVFVEIDPNTTIEIELVSFFTGFLQHENDGYSIPAPAVWPLMGLGFLVFAGWRRYRRN